MDIQDIEALEAAADELSVEHIGRANILRTIAQRQRAALADDMKAAIAQARGVEKTHKFPIGTQFMSTGGKNKKVCTVVDHLTTTNSKGEVVSLRYVAMHWFMGQQMLDANVCETTIARNVTCAYDANAY